MLSRPIYRSTIGRLSTDISNGYLLTIDQVSTDHRPSVDQLLTDTSVKYRPTIGEVSAKCRRSVGERKAISAETHLERLSAVSRPTIDRYIDRLSTECRPTIDRVSTAISTDISRSTLPTVNKIEHVLAMLLLI